MTGGMSVLKAPCKDCPDRHMLCHDTCEKYQAFKKDREKISEIRRKDSDLRSYINGRYSRK